MKLKICSFLVAVSLCGLLSACGETSGDTATDTTAEKTTATFAEEDLTVIENLETEGEMLENPTVTWLSFWDINPEANKAVPVELKLFEEKYGGKIEYIATTWEEKFEKLSTLVASGDSPDMFPAADMDVIPRCVITNLFAPLDDYIDFDSTIWQPVSVINDQFVFQDSHYAAVTGVDAGVVCIYNKKAIEENGLEDPAELYKSGNWNWDTFYDMLLQYCNPEEGKYGIDGWWFESAFGLSTGVPYIGINDGKVVHNLDNPLLEKAQEFMQNLNKQKLPIPKAEFNWQVQPARIGDGLTLFYPVGIWQLYQSNLEDFGEMEDIMFVPMPKCTETDKYYTSVGLSAYSMVAGGKNPEGVKAFMECARIAADSDEVLEIQKKQFFEEYGWTQEMYDMLLDIKELSLENPVVEFYNAVSLEVYELINNPMKKTYNEGASWTQTKEEIRYAVEAELDKANAKAG